VRKLFKIGCPLVILACNSASAQALNRIQKEILPKEFPNHHILGVIHPATEEIINLTHNGHLGILATQTTVNSQAYVTQIKKLNPSIQVSQIACSRLVPLIEARQHYSLKTTQVVKNCVKKNNN